MADVAFPYPVGAGYTFTGATGLTLTGSVVTWTPNTIATKATPIGADSVAGYDSVGTAASRFLLSALPLSAASTAALALKANIGVYNGVGALSGAYTLVAGDKGFLYQSAAVNSPVTIPTNAAVPFPIGTQIDFVRGGAGTLTFVTTGLTIVSSGGTGISATGLGCSIVKLATDTWWIVGNIS